MNNDMSGKVTIITGGGKGIGFGIATAFAKAGSNLAITGRTESTLLKAKEELEDIKDRHTRLIAEFDNLKKRSAKEREGLYASIMGDIISALLPVIDNLEKAAEAESKDEEYKKGIELVLKQFKDVLSANGVKEIEAVGQPFDPELHEAVSMIQDENLGEKIVAQEYRKGYMIGNRVIRHSMVIVAN